MNPCRQLELLSVFGLDCAALRQMELVMPLYMCMCAGLPFPDNKVLSLDIASG